MKESMGSQVTTRQTNNGSDGHAHAMARLVAMHRIIADERRVASKKNSKIRMFLLVTSAFTTGALWALLGGVLPQCTKWIGACLSTRHGRERVSTDCRTWEGRRTAR